MSLLKIENLYIDLLSAGHILPVIQNVSLAIDKKEILAVVGESGCGKSITSLAITRLLPSNIAKYKSGKILFNGVDLLEIPIADLRKIRGKEISYIFQDPFTSLNPIKKIKDQIIESFLIHISGNKKEAIEKAEYLLNKVGINELKERLESYPGQMSGGMLQRISIAMALMCNPSLLIADEPTSALDVTIQSQLIDLLHELKEEIDMSILFISHDIALVGAISQKIAVMYAGQVIETGLSSDVINNPKHPYTQALISSIPSMHDYKNKKLDSISGIVPSAREYPIGCHFSTRCRNVMDICKTKKPEQLLVGTNKVNCFLYSEEGKEK